MNKTTNPTTGQDGLLVQAMSGYTFETITEGRRNEDGTLERRTMEHPTLKYFYPKTGFQALLHRKDERTFMVASVAPPPDAENTLRICVGLLELEVSPNDAREVWLKYITVAPEFQRRGIAKRLLALAAEHMKKKGGFLVRSSASDEGTLKVQSYIDTVLDEQGIAWTQGCRSTKNSTN